MDEKSSKLLPENLWELFLWKPFAPHFKVLAQGGQNYVQCSLIAQEEQ